MQYDPIVILGIYVSRELQDSEVCCQYGFDNEIEYLRDACHVEIETLDDEATYEADLENDTCLVTRDVLLTYFLDLAKTKPLHTNPITEIDYTYEDLAGCCQSICFDNNLLYYTIGDTHGDNSE